MRRAAAAALAGAVALAAAGCGDKGSSTKTQASAGVTTVEKTRVETVTTVSPTPDGKTVAFDPAKIYERDAPGVVTILSITDSGGGGLFGNSGPSGAEGSGFVLNQDGEIVTNAHVVTEGTGSAIRQVDRVYVRFQDDNQVSAKVLGFDPNADVALIKVDPKGLTLRPLQLGADADARVGMPVAAIGSPFGEEQSLSVGVISATDRTIESLTQFSISGAIQTDAAINHGNSGGPLVDAEGNVLGINSQIRSDSGDGTGVGFAVSIDLIKRSVEQLRASGKVEYPYLGVSTTLLYPQLAERLKLPVQHGVLVATVASGGPADKAGLEAGTEEFRFQAVQVPRDADVITKVGDTEIRDSNALSIALNKYKPGDSVDLSIVHDGKPKTVSVKLGSRPLRSQP